MDILITGANGFLGGKITRRITENTHFDVIAVARSEGKVQEMCMQEHIDKRRVNFMSTEDFLKPETKLEEVYGAIHLAFARRTRPAAEIASSLNYSAAVFHKLADNRIERVINLSSQGVYGGTEEIRTEETPPAPENHYTMAKYAAEILFKDTLEKCPYHTNLRLDLVVQNQNVISRLCQSAKQGKIKLRGGKQVFSFIDGEDAAGAVVTMLRTEGNWDEVYNVGWNRERYTLVQLAELVANVAEQRRYKKPEIELEEDDISLWSGMDSSLFMKKTGWKPVVKLGESLRGFF